VFVCTGALLLVMILSENASSPAHGSMLSAVPVRIQTLSPEWQQASRCSLVDLVTHWLVVQVSGAHEIGTGSTTFLDNQHLKKPQAVYHISGFMDDREHAEAYER
jgi:hypothetical protein